MTMQSRNTFWPAAILLISLFLFSLATPKAWNHVKNSTAKPPKKQAVSQKKEMPSAAVTASFDLNDSEEAQTIMRIGEVELPGEPLLDINQQEIMETPVASLIVTEIVAPNLPLEPAIKSEEQFEQTAEDSVVESIETLPSEPTVVPFEQNLDPALVELDLPDLPELPKMELPPIDLRAITLGISRNTQQATAAAKKSLSKLPTWLREVSVQLQDELQKEAQVAIAPKPLEENPPIPIPIALDSTPTRTNALDKINSSSDIVEEKAARNPILFHNLKPGDRFAMRPLLGHGKLRALRKSKENSNTPAKYVAGKLFATPTSLLTELELLKQNPHTADWAKRASLLLATVSDSEIENPQLPNEVAQLQGLVKEGKKLVTSTRIQVLQIDILQAIHGIARRADVYKATIALHQSRTESSAVTASREQVLKSIQELTNMTKNSPHGKSWGTYLQLDEISAMVKDESLTEDARLAAAKKVYKKLTGKNLTDAQHKFIKSETIRRYVESLDHWTDGNVDVAKLLSRMEKFESTGRSSYGRVIAMDKRKLAVAKDAGSVQLAKAINRHYRNANLRVAISADLMNRLIPQPQVGYEAVDDTILGAFVTGNSQTSTTLSVKLVPGAHSLKFGLLANGTVQSRTAASSGPATLHSTGNTRYVAGKLVELTRNGMKTRQAVADAASNTSLYAVDTRFNGIPLLDPLVRSIAINQHDKSYDEALGEVEQRVIDRVSQRMDNDVNGKLAAIESQFRKTILAPLEALSLNPNTVDLNTTKKRAVIRMRLAADAQLAGSSPRPMAPSDSLISFQLHESAINNAASQLKLEGNDLTLYELHKLLAEKMGQEETKKPEDFPKFTSIKFNYLDAVQIRCQDGLVHLTLSIAKVKQRRRAYKKFKVRVTYKPIVDGLDAHLERTGLVEIISKNLRPGDLFAMQAVFVKIFNENPSIRLTPKKLLEDPRMKKTMITQCIIDDGWIGLAIGSRYPKRVAFMIDSGSITK